MFYLYDLYPNSQGENRFEITSKPRDNEKLICVDKSIHKLKESKELLLNDWERDKVPGKHFTPSPGVLFCATGHSRDGLTTYLQPWGQVRSEVEKKRRRIFGLIRGLDVV